MSAKRSLLPGVSRSVFSFRWSALWFASQLPEGGAIAGMLVGTYTGSAPNMAAVGVALLDHVLADGWVTRRSERRILQVTERGRRHFQAELGVVVSQ